MRIVLLLCLFAAAVCGGCTRLVTLKRDLAEAEGKVTSMSGIVTSVSCPSCAVTVVTLDKEGRALSYRVFERPGPFSMILDATAASALAFHDRNRNLRFDFDEPYAWRRIAGGVGAAKLIEGAQLDISQHSGAGVPNSLRSADLMALRSNLVAGVDIQVGQIIKLTDARFEPEVAELGMWQPMQFLKNSFAGIYFLQPYDAKKIPVLFVHGINGTPRDLAALAAGLDGSRYQAWLYYYPSGLEIQTNAIGLLGVLNKLWFEYRFRDLRIVAHSMGGLVTRTYLNDCQREKECDFVRTFVSISSPFGGDSMAEAGVEYSPVVMPVWRSMAPSGPLVSGLFDQPMPERVKHHLIFGFRNSGLLSRKSGDGTIALDSQLRQEAQIQAASTRGFDEDHVSILGSARVSEHVNAILAKESVASRN